MKHTALALTLLLATACGGGGQSGVTAIPGKGAIDVRIDPNPIRATRVSGETYDFPFEVIVRETGGRPISITRVSATVNGPGGFALARESWDAERIRSMGYATTVGPNAEIRYRFSPRKDVPDERLFDGVSAQLLVEAVDDTNSPTTASTNVSVTR